MTRMCRAGRYLVSTVMLITSIARCSGDPSTAPTALLPLASFVSDETDLYDLVLVPGGITWADAWLAAAASGGHLVTITSEAENTLLVGLFDAAVNGFVWIGASDQRIEGDWRWEAGPERGTPLGYSNWGSVEPNNAGDEDVAALNLGPLSPGGTATGAWGDTKTSTLFPGYIIEYSACRGPGDAAVVDAIALPANPVPAGSEVSTAGSFHDPCPLDEHSAQVAWDDGTTSAGAVTETAGAGSVSGSHSYAAAGVYTVVLTVDDGEATGSRSSAQDVPAYVVVYDPSAGFVTGGGWIDSPADACYFLPACARDGSTVGKATFGFTSRYRQGATTPSGHTAFHFAAGDIRFASDTYDWLVIAGARAQFKGIGTINGSGDFGFLLSAIDGALLGGGQPDRFRIKLWDRTNGVVVYDNERWQAEDSDAGTALGAGNIVIKKK